MLLIKNKRLRQVAAVLETGSFLSMKLLVKKRSALNVFPGRVFREYLSLVGTERWSSRGILDLLPSTAPGTRVTIQCTRGEGIYSALDELAYLALLAKTLAPQAIFEIGTFRGRTALNFALNSPQDCVVYTLDLPPDRHTEATGAARADARIIEARSPGSEFLGTDVEHKIRQLHGDSLTFDFSPYHRQMDIVFVDGAHYFEAAISDTKNALRMVRPGGMIIWHDFANYGDYNDVVRAVLACIPADQVFQIESSELAVYRMPGSPASQR